MNDPPDQSPSYFAPARRSDRVDPAEVKHAFGRDPELDAWLTHFFHENHLDPVAYPDHAATADQVRFMVWYDPEEEPFYPCSDWMFRAILRRRASRRVLTYYEQIWQRTAQLVDRHITDPFRRRFLMATLHHKYRHDTSSRVMIPSRLKKRLLVIWANASQITDPLADDKAEWSRRAGAFLAGHYFRKNFDSLGRRHLGRTGGMTDLERRLNSLRLRRLLALSCTPAVWRGGQVDLAAIFADGPRGPGLACLETELLAGEPRRILWVANEAGEFVVDLAVVGLLTRLGHQVMMAVKDGFYFGKMSADDLDEDLSPVLAEAVLLDNPLMSKNDLLAQLDSDRQLFVLPDGTRERLNLIMTSTTFARAFKESDLIIAKGFENRRRLIQTHFQFTRDVVCVSLGAGGKLRCDYKPRHPEAVKMTAAELEARANRIVARLTEARAAGQKVLFYSAIVGSIPGQTETAISVLDTFVGFLRETLDQTFIINPAEYFEPGLDADDLMYMWEIVQRSGLLDIWRFQSAADVEKSFELMGRRVPPEWVGKDATFSTGCTKERHLAQEVQQRQPELQILGPSLERFRRRGEYGVGKYYDARLCGVTPL
jgi:hypothetical protein